MAIKKTRKSKSLPAEPSVSQYREKKSVRITQADNGYTVSCYGPKGEEIRIATSLAGATKHAKELMDSK